MHPLIDVLASIGIRKLFMLSFVLFLAGVSPNLKILFLFLLFLLSYWLVYFYNDFFDLNKDLKRIPSKEKVLAAGRCQLSDYFKMFGLVSVPALALFTLLAPASAALTLAAVFVNNIRTHVSRFLLRELVLVLVEFLNFLALWFITGKPLTPTLVIPLLAASFAYAFMHAAYKLRKPAGALLFFLVPTFILSLVSVFYLSLVHIYAFFVVIMLYSSILLLEPYKNFEELQERHGIALLFVSSYLLLMSAVGV